MDERSEWERGGVVEDIIKKVYLRAFSAGQIPPFVKQFTTAEERSEILQFFVEGEDESEV